MIPSIHKVMTIPSLNKIRKEIDERLEKRRKEIKESGDVIDEKMIKLIKNQIKLFHFEKFIFLIHFPLIIISSSVSVIFPESEFLGTVIILCVTCPLIKITSSKKERLRELEGELEKRERELNEKRTAEVVDA